MPIVAAHFHFLFARLVRGSLTELKMTCSKSTPLHDAFIGHARQRHLIGCSETRTVGAQSVRAP